MKDDTQDSLGAGSAGQDLSFTVDAVTSNGEQPPTRVLQVFTLTDNFQVVELETTSIADLRAKLQHERFGVPVDLFIESSGKKLLDADVVGTLPTDVNLMCIAPMTALLESRLSELESPADECQKYLRSYQGVLAGDARVLKSIWAVAVLAGEVCSAESSKQVELDQVAAAVIMLIQHLWLPEDILARISHGGSGSVVCSKELSPIEPLSDELWRNFKAASVEEFQNLLAKHYSCEAHEQLLQWLLEDPDGTPCEKGAPSPRLRVMLAEIDQILCRGADRLIRGRTDSRQWEAYEELLKVATCSKEHLIHMGAVGKYYGH